MVGPESGLRAALTPSSANSRLTVTSLRSDEGLDPIREPGAGLRGSLCLYSPRRMKSFDEQSGQKIEGELG
jgi:hypothetical protein